jgi:hypothetical protein
VQISNVLAAWKNIGYSMTVPTTFGWCVFDANSREVFYVKGMKGIDVIARSADIKF